MYISIPHLAQRLYLLMWYVNLPTNQSLILLPFTTFTSAGCKLKIGSISILTIFATKHSYFIKSSIYLSVNVHKDTKFRSSKLCSKEVLHGSLVFPFRFTCQFTTSCECLKFYDQLDFGISHSFSLPILTFSSSKYPVKRSLRQIDVIMVDICNS